MFSQHSLEHQHFAYHLIHQRFSHKSYFAPDRSKLKLADSRSLVLVLVGRTIYIYFNFTQLNPFGFSSFAVLELLWTQLFSACSVPIGHIPNMLLTNIITTGLSPVMKTNFSTFSPAFTSLHAQVSCVQYFALKSCIVFVFICIYFLWWPSAALN